MSRYNHPAWQTALAVHERMQRKPLITMILPTALWQDAERLASKMQKADQKNWDAAGTKLRHSLLRLLSDFREQISEIEEEIKLLFKPTMRSSLGNIYTELCVLDEEFNEVEFCFSHKQISVTTDDIQLEGIELGRFQIVLDWNSLNEPFPYSIEALDPNPAASCSSTTHPHIQSSRLCEGEGRVAIRSALEQGRFLDFFILIRQILETYNEDSPHVKLSDWHGINCNDCGHHMDEDDQYRCEQCDTNICGMCSGSCPNCYETNCSECNRKCVGCDDWYCPGCVDLCETCNEYFCKECLSNEKCKECLEAEECEAETTEGSETITPPDSSVHAVCVGEVTLSS